MGEEEEEDEPKKKKKKSAFKKLQKQMRKLLEIVIQYEDQDGRVLSDPFMKLPTRKELPDYYEVIRKPVDISKILTKIEDGKYDDKRFRFTLPKHPKVQRGWQLDPRRFHSPSICF